MTKFIYNFQGTTQCVSRYRSVRVPRSRIDFLNHANANFEASCRKMK